MHKSKVGFKPKKKLTDFFKEEKNKNQHGKVTIQKNEETIAQNGKESITQEPEIGLPFAATPNISFSKFSTKELEEVHERFSKIENSDDPLPKQKHRLQRRVNCLKEQLGDMALEDRDYVPYKFHDEDEVEVKENLSKVGKKLAEWKKIKKERESLKKEPEISKEEREILKKFASATVINKVVTPPKLENEVASPTSLPSKAWK